MMHAAFKSNRQSLAMNPKLRQQVPRAGLDDSRTLCLINSSRTMDRTRGIYFGETLYSCDYSVSWEKAKLKAPVVASRHFRSQRYRVVDPQNERYQRAMEWLSPEAMTSGRPVRTRIIVISMADAYERRARFEERARNAPVPWSFYPAHTGLHPALHYDEQSAIVSKGRPLRPGELGCFSSHYAAWEELQSDVADQYVVLEDDVIVVWTFLGKLVQVNLAEIGLD